MKKHHHRTKKKSHKSSNACTGAHQSVICVHRSGQLPGAVGAASYAHLYYGPQVGPYYGSSHSGELPALHVCWADVGLGIIGLVTIPLDVEAAAAVAGIKVIQYATTGYGIARGMGLPAPGC